MAEVAQAKVELEQSAARLEQIQPEMQALLLAVPNLPHESVPHGERRDRQRGSAPLGHAARVRFRGQGPRRHRRAARPGLRHRREAERRALHGDEAAGGAPASRARAVHARRADAASTATPSATRPTSSTRRPCAAPASCPSSRPTCSPSARADRKDWPRKTSSAVPDSHQRGHADQLRARRDPRGRSCR